MKNLYTILLCLLFSGTLFTIQAQDAQQLKDVPEVSTDKVEVYYFHNERRCATCNAVEDVTEAALDEYYSEQLKAGTVTFQSLNIEEDANEALAKELRISGQTLLIIINGKKKDLTNDAFMYARSNPEKLMEKIHKTIGNI